MDKNADEEIGGHNNVIGAVLEHGPPGRGPEHSGQRDKELKSHDGNGHHDGNFDGNS